MSLVSWHPWGIVVQWQAHLAVGTTGGASAVTASVDLGGDDAGQIACKVHSVVSLSSIASICHVQ